MVTASLVAPFVAVPMVNWLPCNAVVSVPATPLACEELATKTFAPAVVGVNTVGWVSTGSCDSGVVVSGSTVVVEATVGLVASSSSSLRMFFRIKNPTTTAAIAMTMASVEPIGEAPLPDRLGGGSAVRYSCVLLSRASHHWPRPQSSHDDASRDDVEAGAP